MSNEIENDVEPLVNNKASSYQVYDPLDFDTSNGAAAGSSSQPVVSGNITSDRRAAPSRTLAKASIFSFDYYARFFDVDTREVMSRCLLALNPLSKTTFLDDESMGGQLEAQVPSAIAGGSAPDLYGPFWLCTTVIFVLFFASTLVGKIFSTWQGIQYEYQFNLLTGAAGLMYGYTFLLPVVLWVLLRYLNISPSTTVVQLMCLYGYSTIIWIPVAVLSVAPLVMIPTVANILRWLFIGLGFAFSISFIIKNLHSALIPPAGTNTDVNSKPAFIILGSLIAVHGGLAIAVKFLFFAGVKKT